MIMTKLLGLEDFMVSESSKTSTNESNKAVNSVSSVDEISLQIQNFTRSISEGAKEEYEKYFMDKLKEFDVDSPADMSDEDKIKFFNSIKDGWDKENHKPKK